MVRYDLIIVGGGVVGAGLAAALRAAPLNIALIDARMPSNNDPRLFALNIGSCQFLKNIGLWSELASHASPINEVHVSNHGKFGSVRLRADEVSLCELGYVIPARYIEAGLNAELDSQPNCTVYRPATLHSLQQENGLASLRIMTEEGEKTLSTPIVIGADGTESTVRTLLGIHADIHDYAQSALVTRTTLNRSHHQIAYERFNSQGAIAMLPLVGNECATIWTADSKTIDELMLQSDDMFLQTLQKEFGYRLGRLQQISKRHMFPLRMVRAEKAVEECVYLLGNSAHTLHPIAAQGFNLAIYEVAILAEGIMDKLTRQEPITAIDLETMNAQTEKQQSTSIGVSHRLSQIFASESSLMGLATQVGMVSFNLATPLKRNLFKTCLDAVGVCRDYY